MRCSPGLQAPCNNTSEDNPASVNSAPLNVFRLRQDSNKVDAPAVLGIQAARQTPRYAPVSKVRQVQESATLETVSAVDGSGEGLAVIEMRPPETGEGAQMLADAEELLELLDSKGVL